MVFLWDVATGRVIRKFKGHSQRVNCISFNHTIEAGKNAEDCSVLVTGSYDKSIKIWDCKSNNYEPIQVHHSSHSESELTNRKVMEDAKDSITSVFVSKYEIIASSVDGSVRTYDIRKGTLYTDHIGQPVVSVKLSHDNNCLLLSCLDNTLKLIDRSDGSLLNEYKGHVNKDYKIDSILSCDDSYVISGSEDNCVYVWDLVDAKVIAKLKVTELNTRV